MKITVTFEVPDSLAPGIIEMRNNIIRVDTDHKSELLAACQVAAIGQYETDSKTLLAKTGVVIRDQRGVFIGYQVIN